MSPLPVKVSVFELLSYFQRTASPVFPLVDAAFGFTACTSSREILRTDEKKALASRFGLSKAFSSISSVTVTSSSVSEFSASTIVSSELASSALSSTTISSS
jgi:hypothetical protein